MLTKRLLGQVKRFIPGANIANVPFDEGRSRVAVDLTTSLGRILYSGGSMDLAEMSLVRSRLNPGDTFIDVGANVGLYTLVAAARVGAAGRVIAFEPTSTTRAMLQSNVALNHYDWIQVRNEAVSDQSGEATITAFEGDHSGFSSLKPPTVTVSGVEEKVRLIRLDDICAELSLVNPTFIKIDVEGAEAAVLRGAASTLCRYQPDLLLEIEPKNLARHDARVEDLEAALPAEYRSYRAHLEGSELKLVPQESIKPAGDVGYNAFLTVKSI